MRRSKNHSSFKMFLRRILITLRFFGQRLLKNVHEILIGPGTEKRIRKKCDKNQLENLGLIIYLEIFTRCNTKWQYLVVMCRDVHKRVSGLSLHPV